MKIFRLVRPVNVIVPFFWSFFAIAIRLQFSRTDGAGRRLEVVQQVTPYGANIRSHAGAAMAPYGRTQG